jgi:hypothetical protein
LKGGDEMNGNTMYVLFYIVFVTVVSYFGSSLGYTVNGVDIAGDSGGFDTNAIVGYFWNMLTFSIDGMPIWINLIFVVLSAVFLWCLKDPVLKLAEIIAETIPG